MLIYDTYVVPAYLHSIGNGNIEQWSVEWFDRWKVVIVLNGRGGAWNWIATRSSKESMSEPNNL